jgi:serine/threonine-protein kinase
VAAWASSTSPPTCVSSVASPGIVPIYHAGEADRTVYFAMGFVDGESMAERIARDGPIPPAELVPLLVQVADALGYAHAHGVVHRDIKAENVLLDRRTGRPLITDFGIARVTEAQPLTATGTVLGTVHYMSPEQVTGDALDGRSDLYALGVMAFLAATGKFPFERPSAPAVLIAHVNSAPPRVHELRPDLPDALDAVVARLLEKNPADRFADAASLVAALRAIDGIDAGAVVPYRAAAVASVSAPPADVYSATEAQQIWDHAAQLQANTGVAVPAPVFTPRDPGRAPTTPFDASLVRASAVEAGIDAKYVDRAIAARDAAAAGALAPATVRPGEIMAKRPNLFLGARTRLEFEAEIDGEVTDLGFEEIADEVRRALGEMVSVSGVGRTLTVTTAATGGGSRNSSTPRHLQVLITSRGGRTRIHAFENLQQSAGTTFGGIMGGVGGGGGGMWMGVIAGQFRNPALGAAAWGTWILACYAGARILYTRTVRNRERELREAVERVVAVATRHVKK